METDDMKANVSKLLPQSSATYSVAKGANVTQRTDVQTYGQSVRTGPEAEKTQSSGNKKEQVSKGKLEEALAGVNSDPAIIEKRLHFKIHDATGNLFVEITNADTGKVLGQIPPKELLDLQARLKAADSPAPEGLLVDSTV
jgi:flagellar protein FlaG